MSSTKAGTARVRASILRRVAILAAAMVVSLSAAAADGVVSRIDLAVQWNQPIGLSKTVPTLLICPHPALRSGSPVHDQLFAALRDLRLRYVRYLAWYPYPRLSVAELEPPSKDGTSWDFSAMDSIVVPFLEATKGHEPVLDFGTIPAWMFKTDSPPHYAADPNEVVDGYTQGTELVDPSGKQLAEYFARVASWYAKGGFTDEHGRYHHSGYHYDLPWWGVLNEVDSEHDTTPQQYTARYDAIVTAVRQVLPDTKFVGIGLGLPSLQPEFFEYFLNPQNHQPGMPLDMVAYHFYAGYFAGASPKETINEWQYTFFHQANGFLNTVRYIESIRKRLSPKTSVNIEELGTIVEQIGRPGPQQPLPPEYWNLSGALYAYMYAELMKLGIDVVAESQLLTDFPEDDSIAMMDATTGRPNARFRVLQLIQEHFGPGDQLFAVRVGTGWTPTGVAVPFGDAADLTVQAFGTPKGRRLLIVNKRSTPVDLVTSQVGEIAELHVVDTESAGGPPRRRKPAGDTLRLGPFAVAVALMK